MEFLVSENRRKTHPRTPQQYKIKNMHEPEELKPLVKEVAFHASNYALHDAQWLVRSHALDALAFLGDRRSERLFREILSDKADWIYSGLDPREFMIGNFTGQPEEIIRSSVVPRFKDIAVEGIAKIGGRENVELLMRIMHGSDSRLSKSATFELAAHATPGILRMFIGMANFKNMNYAQSQAIMHAAAAIVEDLPQFNVHEVIYNTFSEERNTVEAHEMRLGRSRRPKELMFIPNSKVAILMAANALGTLPKVFKSGEVLKFANEHTEEELARHYKLIK